MIFLFFLVAFNLPDSLLNSKSNTASPTPERPKYMHSSATHDTLTSVVEKFFEDITGEKLKQVGYAFFQPREIPELPVGIPKGYTLGPGDEIIIYFSGELSNVLRLKINREGQIFVPDVGIINLWGLDFDKARERIQQSIHKKLNNVKINVSMGNLRGVRVYITGHVYRPGPYIVPATFSCIDALSLAGGPDKGGTLRHIKIIHTNGSSDIIDLYTFLLNGKPVHMQSLKQGDIIYVGPAGSFVAITGNVKMPGIYEIKDSETLGELLSSRGTLPFIQERVVIRRLVEDSSIVIELNFKDLHKFKLKNGDVISIPALTPVVTSYVKISGNVIKPGVYQFTQGESLKELISKAGSFRYTPDTTIFIYRYKNDYKRVLLKVKTQNTHGFRLKSCDSVVVFSFKELHPVKPVSITGEVRSSVNIAYIDSMSIADILRLSHPKPDAEKRFVLLLRKDITSKIKHSEFSSTFLNPGDMIYVLKDTLSSNKIKVILKGEVKYPGTYVLPKGSSIQKLIGLAGGTLSDAYLRGSFIKRIGINQVNRNNAEKIAQSYAISSFSFDSIPSVSAAQLSAIKGLNMTDIISFKNSDEFLRTKLFKNVTVRIPSKPLYVTVSGAVQRPFVLKYSGKKSGYAYLSHIPLVQNADRKSTYIVSYNGYIKGAANEVYPGDIIVVPYRKKVSTWYNVKQISSVLYQMTIALLAVYQVYRWR